MSEGHSAEGHPAPDLSGGNEPCARPTVGGWRSYASAREGQKGERPLAPLRVCLPQHKEHDDKHQWQMQLIGYGDKTAPLGADS